MSNPWMTQVAEKAKLEGPIGVPYSRWWGISVSAWMLSLLLAGSLGTGAAEPSPSARIQCVEGDGFVDLSENGIPILRYSHGNTSVPEGIGKEFERGDYVSELYGLNGELLTEDYPKDHPHHRAVNWSWATVKWNGEERDLFAVRGIWSRPAGKPQMESTGGSARISAESVWKWDDKVAVVSEKVVIRVFPRTDEGRAVDFDITLTALADGLEFCGRLEAGYSGFNIRMAPAKGQEIKFLTDPAEAKPRRAWADYSAEFPGGRGRSGLAILQSAENPMYPQEWREYPQLNFFQPLYPGGRLIPMLKGKPVELHYRLWMHSGGAGADTLAVQWDKYNQRTQK